MQVLPYAQTVGAVLRECGGHHGDADRGTSVHDLFPESAGELPTAANYLSLV